MKLEDFPSNLSTSYQMLCSKGHVQCSHCTVCLYRLFKDLKRLKSIFALFSSSFNSEYFVLGFTCLKRAFKKRLMCVINQETKEKHLQRLFQKFFQQIVEIFQLHHIILHARNDNKKIIRKVAISPLCRYAEGYQHSHLSNGKKGVMRIQPVVMQTGWVCSGK